MMSERVPVAILEDGSAWLVLLAQDLPRIPQGADDIPVSAERADAGILLWLPGRFAPDFSLDPQSEAAIRHAGRLGILLLDGKGAHRLETRLLVDWPLHLAPVCRR